MTLLHLILPLGGVSIQSHAGSEELVTVGGLWRVVADEPPGPVHVVPVVEGLQLVLPIPAQGFLVLVNPLGQVFRGNMPLVDDVDPVDCLEILDTLLEFSDDFLVVGVKEVCWEAGILDIVEGSHDSDEGNQVAGDLLSEGVDMAQDIIAVIAH